VTLLGAAAVAVVSADGGGGGGGGSGGGVGRGGGGSSSNSSVHNDSALAASVPGTAAPAAATAAASLVAAAALAWAAPTATSRPLPPPWLLWPPPPRRLVAETAAAVRAPARADGAGWLVRDASDAPAPTPAAEAATDDEAAPFVEVPFPLARIKTFYRRISRVDGCVSDSVSFRGLLRMPSRPGVFFIPHALMKMGGATCGTEGPSGALPTWALQLTSETDLEALTDAQRAYLLGLTGMVVTRVDNVRTRAAAEAAGTVDLWEVLFAKPTTASIFVASLTWRDVWVGVELDAARRCGIEETPVGTVYLFFYLSPPTHLELQHSAVYAEPNNSIIVAVGGQYQRVCVYGANASTAAAPTPPPPTLVDPTSDLGFRSCFPAAAAVVRADGSTAAMADVAVGDVLRVSAAGDGGSAASWSAVYMFAHRLAGGAYEFVELATSDAGRPTLTLSPGHLVYLADGRLVAAAAVVPGDGLQPAAPLAVVGAPRGGGVRVPGNGSAAAAAAPAAPAVWVTTVTRRRLPGLYNPMTLHGDLIVDGYRVSTYTTAMPPRLGGVLSAPLRALYAATGLSTGLLEGGPERYAPAALWASTRAAARSVLWG